MIDRVAQLLIGQLFSGDVDRLKPFQLLAIGARAEIDHAVVFENLLLLIVLEIVEIDVVDGEVAVDVLANRDRPLLSVNHFKPAVIPHRPIHHVERKILAHGVEHRVALSILVNELALIRRANIELPAKTNDSRLGIVGVAVGELLDRDFVEFDLHCCLLRRIKMRGYV